jgi:hypothetical protein
MRIRTVLLAVLAAGLVTVSPLAGPARSQAMDPPRPGPSDKARAEAAGRQAESGGVSIARAHVGAVPQQFATLRVFATQYNPTTPGSVEVAVPDKCVKFAALGNQAILNQFGCPQPGYQIGRDYRVFIFRDNGRSGAIPVKEVGPWNIDDNYWDFGPGGSPRPRRLFRDLEYGLPESQAAFERDYNFKPCLNLDRTPSGRSDGADQFDRCVLNPAGIDLSVAAAAQLGIAPLQNEWVTALFLWEPVRNTITSVRSNQNVDVSGVSQADGAPVIQWPGNGGANQQWRFEGVAPNTYRIVAVHSGKVLDVEGASTADGARVIQWPWHGGTNQQWRFEGVGPGEYRIVSVRSGKVLDVAGESLANGAPIIQWSYHGRTNQRWRLTIVGNG